MTAEKFHAKSLSQLRQLDEHGLRRAETRAAEQIVGIQSQLRGERAQTDVEWKRRAAQALTHWRGQQKLIDGVRREMEVDPEDVPKAFRRLYQAVTHHLTKDTPDSLEGVRLAMNQIDEHLSRET